MMMMTRIDSALVGNGMSVAVMGELVVDRYA